MGINRTNEPFPGSTARRVLWTLADTGEIEAASGEGTGAGPILWRLKERVKND